MHHVLLSITLAPFIAVGNLEATPEKRPEPAPLCLSRSQHIVFQCGNIELSSVFACGFATAPADAQALSTTMPYPLHSVLSVPLFTHISSRNTDVHCAMGPDIAQIGFAAE